MARSGRGGEAKLISDGLSFCFTVQSMSGTARLPKGTAVFRAMPAAGKICVSLDLVAFAGIVSVFKKALKVWAAKIFQIALSLSTLPLH